jgi:hypothetical protein
LIRDNQGRSRGNRNGHEADHGISRIDAPYHIADAIDGPDAIHDMVCGPRPVKQHRNRPLLARQRAALLEIDYRGWPCASERLSLQS